MNEFEKIFNEMNLDRALLPILFRSNRAVADAKEKVDAVKKSLGI